VEIRAAQARGGDANDYVVRLADARVGDLLDPDIALAVPGDGLNGLPLPG
jgi:hypothetical protein